jgi:hypothetical protein
MSLSSLRASLRIAKFDKASTARSIHPEPRPNRAPGSAYNEAQLLFGKAKLDESICYANIPTDSKIKHHLITPYNHCSISLMKFSAFALALLSLAACSNPRHKAIRKTDWLIGTWISGTPEGPVYETWTKTSADELRGKSYQPHGADTTVFETIRLIEQHDTLFFIPTLLDQNDGKPVRFSLKTISDSSMVFENIHHNFPQLVSYTRVASDSLMAEISGTQNGKQNSIQFPMKLLK